MPANTPLKLLQDSGLNEALAQKAVKRVHLIMLTEAEGCLQGGATLPKALMVSLSHESLGKDKGFGKGYAWISGHVEDKDQGSIWQTE